MKNYIVVVIAVVLTMAGAIFLVNQNPKTVGGGTFSRVTVTSTTTSATVNKPILATNVTRKYALLTNDSDTVMYLYPGYFESQKSASTTLMYNLGIRLNANGGSYEIDDDSLYVGQLWLATTTASKKLLIIEK